MNFSRRVSSYVHTGTIIPDYTRQVHSQVTSMFNCSSSGASLIKLEAVRDIPSMSAIVKYPVVVFKQTSDPGFLFAVKKFLGQRMNPADVKIDNEAFEIVVHNHSAKEVREFVKQYNRGLTEGGHGGFRGHPTVVEREIDLEQELRTVTAERDALEQELESGRQNQAELGDKWGDDRRDYEESIDLLTRRLIKRKKALDRMEEEYDQLVLAEREERQQLLRRWRRTPLWKVGWQRLLALVDSEREG